MRWSMTAQSNLVKGTFLFLTMLVCVVFTSRAQTPTPPSSEATLDPVDSLLDFSTAPVLPEEPVETNRIKLLHKQASELRDPFWPVGYTPPRKEPPQTAPVTVSAPAQPAEPVVVERPPRWDDALRTVSIKGIMSVGAGKYMAVVNDLVVNEGDTVSVTFEGRRYTWKIARITADGVKFQKLTVSK